MRRSDDRLRESRSSRDYIDEERLRDLERKRREWRIEQEKRREHEKRKQKMIEEWEAKRAREIALKKQRRRSKSRSRSASPGSSRRRGRSTSVESRRSRISSKAPVMSEKCDSSSTANTPLFKGSEGSKISINELKKIKVNIQREISNAEDTSELLRDITSPDEIVLKRREGLTPEATSLRERVLNVSVGITREGAKPIFEREDIKMNDSSGDEVRERRIIVAVDKIETDKRTSSKYSRSVSSDRRRSQSSRRPSRMGDCIFTTSPANIDLYFSLGEGSKPIFEREELKTEEKATADVPERRTVVAVDEILHDEKRSRTRRSRSLSSGRHTSRSSCQASRHDAVSKFYTQSHRRENSQDRRDRGIGERYRRDRQHHGSRESVHQPSRDFRSHRSSDADRIFRAESNRDSMYREHHDYENYPYSGRNRTDRRPAALSYAEPITFPMYYDNLVRPMMIDPMMMMRAPLPIMRGRMPPMLATFRPPYRPRFMPPEMFRLNTPPNQRK